MTKYCKLSKVLYRKLQIHFKIHYAAMTEIKKSAFFVSEKCFSEVEVP